MIFKNYYYNFDVWMRDCNNRCWRCVTVSNSVAEVCTKSQTDLSIHTQEGSIGGILFPTPSTLIYADRGENDTFDERTCTFNKYQTVDCANLSTQPWTKTGPNKHTIIREADSKCLCTPMHEPLKIIYSLSLRGLLFSICALVILYTAKVCRQQ